MTPEDRVLDHYEYPYHKHVSTDPYDDYHAYFVGSADNDCGDNIRVWGRYDTSLRIVCLRWEGSGCCFSQATASMLAERCEAMRLHEVRSLTQDDMLDLFKVDVEPARIECVMVAYRALMKALENYHV